MTDAVEVRSLCGRTLTMTDGTEREMTDREHALYEAIEEATSQDTHGVWWEFSKQFGGSDSGNFNLPYERWDEIESFAEKYPDWVRIAGCDDHLFMSSMIVFVRHGTGDNYMGQSVLYIQQCGEVAQFFLYPGHTASVLDALADAPTVRTADEMIERMQKKPGCFDAFNDRWKQKAWYGEMGIDLENATQGSVCAGKSEEN